jgi:hypothetical protein
MRPNRSPASERRYESARRGDTTECGARAASRLAGDLDHREPRDTAAAGGLIASGNPSVWSSGWRQVPGRQSQATLSRAGPVTSAPRGIGSIDAVLCFMQPMARSANTTYRMSSRSRRPARPAQIRTSTSSPATWTTRPRSSAALPRRSRTAPHRPRRHGRLGTRLASPRLPVDHAR